MHPVFKDRVWELAIEPPWRATDCEYCIEITQPEGVGALHIMSARKMKGMITPAETKERMTAECPNGTDIEKIRCGDFAGHTGEYVDWNTSAYWKKWLLAYQNDLLFATYTCPRGEEELGVYQVAKLLTTLRSKT